MEQQGLKRQISSGGKKSTCSVPANSLHVGPRVQEAAGSGLLAPPAGPKAHCSASGSIWVLRLLLTSKCSLFPPFLPKGEFGKQTV